MPLPAVRRQGNDNAFKLDEMVRGRATANSLDHSGSMFGRYVAAFGRYGVAGGSVPVAGGVWGEARHELRLE